MENRATTAEKFIDDVFLDSRITYVKNPIEEDYNIIREKYWNKWVAIYQPDHLLTFERGTVVAYADANEDASVSFTMGEYMSKNFGRGLIKQFKEEDMEDCYVIFRNVR